MTALGLTGLTGCSGHAAHPVAAAPASPQFIDLSRRLTGYGDLDKALAGRIEAVLRRQTSGFDAILSALARAGIPSSLDGLPAAVRPLAAAILGAWQTGVAGEGVHAVVVAYEDALMYRPIADVCVLPTYARGEPHYWAQPLPARLSA